MQSKLTFEQLKKTAVRAQRLAAPMGADWPLSRWQELMSQALGYASFHEAGKALSPSQEKRDKALEDQEKLCEAQRKLHAAVHGADSSTARESLEAGADPNAKNVFAPSAFEEAIASIRKRRGPNGIIVDVEERLGFMVEAGADLFARDQETGNTALHAALSEISTPYGEPEMVAKNLGFAKRLIKMEPRLVNSRNHRGEAPLHHACFCSNLEATVFLIAQGAGVDAVDRYGVSALIQAVNNASIACVEALLGAKALFPEFLPDGLDASTLYDLCVKASKRVSPVQGGNLEMTEFVRRKHREIFGVDPSGI